MSRVKSAYTDEAANAEGWGVVASASVTNPLLKIVTIDRTGALSEDVDAWLHVGLKAARVSPLHAAAMAMVCENEREQILKREGENHMKNSRLESWLDTFSGMTAIAAIFALQGKVSWSDAAIAVGATTLCSAIYHVVKWLEAKS